MKKLLALALTLVMALTVFTACGSKKDDSKATKAVKEQVETVDTTGVKTLKDGVLKVGIEIGYPPFETMKKDGKTPEGYDIDIIEAVAERLGLKVEYVNTAFDGIFDGIDKNYDVVCSAITINKERKKTMLFSDPYITNYQALVVKSDDNRKVKSFKDLAGMKIALQEGTTSKEIMDDLIGTKTIKNTKYIENEKITGCFDMLKNGEVEGILLDSTVADSLVAKDKAFKIAWVDNTEPEEFGIPMGKKNVALQKAINAALKDMNAKGIIKDSQEYWFGQDK